MTSTAVPSTRPLRGPLVDARGPGDDHYVGGNKPLVSRVDFRGGDGFDLASYFPAERGVRLSNDGVAVDGRIGLDQDNIRPDVELLTGSRFSERRAHGELRPPFALLRDPGA